jgi:phosphoribosylformylglycinamidine synthase
LELNEASPLSAVQIGDPITQKKMLDFLMEARKLELINSITDNGAGGLSSSLGEMAEQSGGVRIDLERCPLKYHGLAPWEILLSESQERMSLAVSPDNITDFLSLAKKHGVTASVIGEFTDSGYVQVRYESKTVAYLPLEFLHHGNPQLKLEAVWKTPDKSKQYDLSEMNGDDIKKYFKKILADPNVASKEFLIRQYDHEVIGQSVIKPFTGLFSDAPSDGAVLRPVYDSFRGLTVTHGICPRYSDFDTYHMAMCAVDEAYRAHIACGGNPDYVSALDNFCWPDPVYSQDNPDGKYKLAQLVRAAKGMYACCKAYGIPLISGKDSMKNDTKIEGKKISVRPTLLITVLGIIDDIRKAVSTDFKNSGDLIYCLGETKKELGGSILEKILEKPMGPSPLPVPENSLPLYRNLASCIATGMIKSCHDCSDGGLGVTIAESILGGRYGADIHAEKFPGFHVNELNIPELLFSETQSRFIISIDPSDKHRFEQLINQGHLEKNCQLVGEVTTKEDFRVFNNGKTVLSVSIKDIENTWFSFQRDMI